MKLSKEQVDQFQEEGYLVVKGALETSDLKPVIDEYIVYIDRRARELHAEGKISQTYEEEPFERRIWKISQECLDLYGELDIMKLRGKAAFDFLRNQNLLDAIEALVGPEITCSPIQHVRAKMPQGVRDDQVIPWHQDAGVTLEEADPVFILTVWLPLTEATLENGCLQVIPRVAGLRTHHKGDLGTTIVPDEMPDSEGVALPVSPGDLILMHKEVPHRSTPNVSEAVRWSVDLRFQKTGTPTGRPHHPHFVVRSQENPDAVLTDHQEWCNMWIEGLEKGKGARFHRVTG
ncbi:MAG: phytanoyl-CoA dioxygenase family protein [bacterium]|nr:phytanoyl-CoA dioxygenase family protein [bacterium]